MNELNDQLSDSEKKQSILEELQSEHDTLQQKLSAMCKQLSDCQAKSERRRVELYRLQKCNHSKSINTRFGSEKVNKYILHFLISDVTKALCWCCLYERIKDELVFEKIMSKYFLCIYIIVFKAQKGTRKICTSRFCSKFTIY